MANESLRLVGGPLTGQEISLTGELVLGRSEQGLGALGGDEKLSRRHARLVREPDGRIAVEDLGSTNGTFVNEQRISGRRVLSPGDRVRVGGSTIELAAPGAAQAPVLPFTS